MQYADIKARFERQAGFAPTDIQVEDAETTALDPSVLNASDVGTGKTVVSTVASLLREGVDVTLVVVPPILIPQWVEWLGKVGDGPVVGYVGVPARRHKLPVDTARWVVMSHAIYRDESMRWYKLGMSKSVEIIVDEAHAAKNATSKLFNTILKQPKIALQMVTGTPTSKPGDCYTYIKLRTPKVYRSLSQFEAVHVADRDIFGQITEWRELDLLAERFNSKIIKRTKREVFGYNLDPIFMHLNYDLDKQHLKLYTQLVEEQLLELPDGGKVDATTATRLYHALQQVVCNWHEFAGEEFTACRSAVYDLLDVVVEDTRCLEQGRSKLIVFTHYKRTSRNILAYLLGAFGQGIAVAAYSEVDSNASIERFLNDPTCRILVGQPSSCGVGLNPAHLCSEVLFVESSTTPLLMQQAIGRVDRKGQTVRPTIRFAIAKGTIQESLYDRLIQNSDLVAKVERHELPLRDMLLGGIDAPALKKRRK